MPYVSVRRAARALGVSDGALLDWMDRDLVPTVDGPDGERRLPETSVDSVLARLPRHSDQHGLTEAQVEAILIRGAGHRGEVRRSRAARRATPWQTVKAIISAVLEWRW